MRVEPRLQQLAPRVLLLLLVRYLPCNEQTVMLRLGAVRGARKVVLNDQATLDQFLEVVDLLLLLLLLTFLTFARLHQLNGFLEGRLPVVDYLLPTARPRIGCLLNDRCFLGICWGMRHGLLIFFFFFLVFKLLLAGATHLLFNLRRL